jgi:hypothetical protein
MLPGQILPVYTETHTKRINGPIHAIDKMQSNLVLKQVVHKITIGL